MKLKELVENAFWYGVVSRISQFISLFTLPFITPYLTQDDYGTWGIISAYVEIAIGIAPLGLYIHLSNSYYEYQRRFKLVWRRLAFWMLMGGVIGAIIIIVILSIELPYTEPYNRSFVIFVSSIPVFLYFNSIIAEHYYGLKLAPRPLVTRQVASSFCGVVVLFVLVYFFRLGFLGWIISTAVSAIVLFLLLIKPLWLSLKLYPIPNNFNKRTVKWFKISLPLVTHSIGHILIGSSSKIIMVSIGVGITDIGIYTNGFMIGAYASILILSVLRSLGPVIQTTFRDRNHAQMRKLFVLVEVFAILVIFVLSVWMREIYQILVRNESLQVSYTVASYTCFSLAMYPLYTLLMTVATIEKQTKYILWLVLFPGLVGVGLNLIFMPFFGYRTAIFVVLFSHWIIAAIGYCVPYYRKHLHNWLGKAHYIFIFLIMCITTLVLAQYLGDISILPKSIITISAILICLIMMYRYKDLIMNFNLVHNDIKE